PMATVPKLRLVGESFAVVPIPLRVTFCGLPVALSVMLNTAWRAPDALGANLTLIVQLAPTANEVPQLVDREKSPAFVPEIPMPISRMPLLLLFFNAGKQSEDRNYAFCLSWKLLEACA